MGSMDNEEAFRIELDVGSMLIGPSAWMCVGQTMTPIASKANDLLYLLKSLATQLVLSLSDLLSFGC